MSIALDEEQLEIAHTARAFLSRRSSEAEVRRVMETSEGFDRGVWRKMAEELQLQGLLVPTWLGGAGLTQVELGVVFEEMGRALLCAPYLATVGLAVNAILAANDDAAEAELLPDIAEGRTIATLAYVEGSRPLASAAPSCQARRGRRGWTLRGEKDFVIDGAVADLVLVLANSHEGPTLFALEAAAVTAAPLRTLDLTRRVARLSFVDVPARVIGAAGAGSEIVERALALACVALSAEAVGAAQRALDMAVEHAGQRVQFSRPIGSFQAVKHSCADLLVEVECARALAYEAMRVATTEDSAELEVAASTAKAFCSEALMHVAEENIQIHGGIGFTWEHPAHLYFRRAKSTQLLLGDPAEHRLRVALALTERLAHI